MREQLTDLRTWTVPVLATGLAMLLSVLCHAFLQPYPFAFFVAAMLVSAWYGRLTGSLIATALGVGLLLIIHAKHLDTIGTDEVQQFGLRLGMFAFLGVITGYLSRRCYQAIDAFDGLHQTLACLGQGVLITDVQANVVYGNAEAERLTGLEPKEFRDRRLHDVLQVASPSDGAVVRLDLARLLEERNPLKFPDDALLKTRRGEELPIQGACSPIMNGDGQPLGGIVTLRDDTRQRAFLTDLRNRDRWARGLLQDAPIALLVLDSEGRCVQVSSNAIALVDVSADHWLQDGWHALIHPEDRERVLQGYRSAIGGRQPFQTELRMENESGDNVWIRLHAKPTALDDPAKVLAIATLENMTAEKRLEHQLDEARSLLHAVAQASPDAVFLKDGEGRCLLANAAGANWQLGAVGDELAQAEREARSTEKPHEVAFSAQPVLARIVPYLDADNRFAGLVTFLRDTSSERALQDERQTWRRQAEQLGQEINTLKSRFAGERQKLEADGQRMLQELGANRDRAEAALRKQLAESERLAKAAQEANAQLMNQVEELRRENEARQQTIGQLEATIADSRAEVQLLEEEVAKLQGQEKVDPAQAEALAQLQAELATLEQRLQDQEQVHGSTIESNRRAAEERERHLQCELTTREHRLREQAEAHGSALDGHRRTADERERLAQEEMQRWWADQERGHLEKVRQLQGEVQHQQEQLRSAERRSHVLATLVRHVPEGILALDAQDRYLAWNDQLARWTGKPADQVVGRAASELFEELGDLGEDRSASQLFREENVVQKRGLLVLAEDGQSRRLDATYAPLWNGQGEFLGAVAIVRESSVEEQIIEATPLPDDFGDHLLDSPPPLPPVEREPAQCDHAGDWLAFN